MAATLTEPAVLAAAKETLYPNLDTSPDHYAVTETQFTKPTWGGWEIPEELRHRLAPYNTIHLTDGEPDLLGQEKNHRDILRAPDPAELVEFISNGHERGSLVTIRANCSVEFTGSRVFIRDRDRYRPHGC